MNAINLTHHAVLRMQQRGISEADLSLIMELGTETETGFLLRRKDVEKIEHDMKRLVSRLHRLVGKRVVAEGDTVVTAYHATKNDQKRLLQRH